MGKAQRIRGSLSVAFSSRSGHEVFWKSSACGPGGEASLLSDSLLPGGKRCGAGIRKLPSCADCPACDSEVSCKSLVHLKGVSRVVCGLMVSV